MEDITLRDIYYIFRKRIGLIIILPIITIIIGGLVSQYLLEPEYETFTTLMIGKPKDYGGESNIEYMEYNDLMVNQKLVSTYGEIVKSRRITDKVINNLDLEMSYEEFRNKVDVNLIKDTEIIKLQAVDSDPKLAARLANETAVVFIRGVKSIMNIENVQVIDLAQVPTRPVKPRKTLNIAVAGVLGLILSIFIAFVVEFLDNSIKTSEDVENNFGIPVIGSIPIIKLEDENNPKSLVSEAFRTLRTNIQFLSIDREIKTIVFTSSSPEEGKTTVVANLANSIAMTEKKVLIIDCDLRCPRLHQIYKVRNTKGLTNILMGEKTLEEVEYIDKNKSSTLRILTSGPLPPNPSELLSSIKMKKFLEEIKGKFDMIILDSPPIGLVTDSAILSTMVDGTILVVEAGKTNIEDVKKSKEALDKVNTNIIGTIINKISIARKESYNYDSSQYGKYYGKELKNKKIKTRIN